jgi:hypothetical protein
VPGKETPEYRIWRGMKQRCYAKIGWRLSLLDPAGSRA